MVLVVAVNLGAAAPLPELGVSSPCSQGKHFVEPFPLQGKNAAQQHKHWWGDRTNIEPRG